MMFECLIVLMKFYTSIHYFSKYLGDQDLENTSIFTNLYATQQFSSHFELTTKQEIKEFIALHLEMGKVS